MRLVTLVGRREDLTKRKHGESNVLQFKFLPCLVRSIIGFENLSSYPMYLGRGTLVSKAKLSSFMTIFIFGGR